MGDPARARALHASTRGADPVSPVSLFSERERRGNGRAIHARLQGHAALMRRLALDATLAGHEGCVNHLRWNAAGSLLASGSDDTRLLLWDYATHACRARIDTGHRLNIFAVCFVPHTHDHILATGAMDKEVRIHYAPFRRDATKRFRFHTGRVKDIASSAGVPKVFWSVAEDGLVFQFDVRALPRSDGSAVGSSEGDGDAASGALIRLGKARNGTTLRGMAMASHPLDTTKVVVACGDFYSRLFDRRMLRTQTLRARRHGESGSAAVLTSEAATVPVEIFAPPHLHMDFASDASARRRHDESHGTSIQFSRDGAEILANYHNDHIYLFRSHHRELRPTDDSGEGGGGGGDVTLPATVFDKSALRGGDAAIAKAVDASAWMDGITMDQCVVPPRAARALTRTDLQTRYSRALVLLMARSHSAALDVFFELCSARHTLAAMSDSFRKDVFHGMAKAYLGRAWRADEYLAAQFAMLAESLDASDREVQLTLIRALKAGQRSRQLVVRARKYQASYPMFAHDVDELLNEAVRRPSVQRDRRLRVYRRRRRRRSNDDSEEEGTEERGSRGHEDDRDENDDDNDDDDGGDDDSSDSSEGELHVEADPVQPDSEDGGFDESGHNDDGDGDDTDSRFWQRPLRDGLRVNCDVARRFIGYCNLQTDIKEATFFGPNDECIVAGSDDGKAYIWLKNTGRLLNAIDADADIVNCVQPHPIDTCLATSGIENVVRLWKPTGDASTAPSDEDLAAFVEHNQTSMADSASYFLSGANPNIIRLIFNSAEQEGVQECATS